MTWPASTPIVTTNVSSDSASPLSARPQIKQVFDDVNLMKAATATETLRGPVEIATQAETTAGTDDTRVITPLKLKTNITPAAVAGYFATTKEYRSTEFGTGLSTFTASTAVAASTWESVGPTGSGADNIWTAMDVIPTTAKYIIFLVTLSIQGSTVNVPYRLKVNARVGGSSLAVSNINNISDVYFEHNATAGVQYGLGTREVKVPLDASRIFDIYWSESGAGPSSAIYMSFHGWGE